MDVAKVVCCLETQKVYVEMHDRVADIMVEFRRPNTMKRFISFCGWEQIDLTETSWWVLLGVITISYCSRLLLTIYSETMERSWAAISSKTSNGGKEDVSRNMTTVCLAEFRHDGAAYTSPKCMEGVPVEKIAPNHPY